MGTARLSEWLWRFLATVMAFAVGWSMWIFYQLNPSPLVTNIAFEAAAGAKAKHNTKGMIAPAASAPTASAPAESPPPPAVAPAEPKLPPINADKLRLSDSLTTPEAKK